LNTQNTRAHLIGMYGSLNTLGWVGPRSRILRILARLMGLQSLNTCANIVGNCLAPLLFRNTPCILWNTLGRITRILLGILLHCCLMHMEYCPHYHWYYFCYMWETALHHFCFGILWMRWNTLGRSTRILLAILNAASSCTWSTFPPRLCHWFYCWMKSSVLHLLLELRMTSQMVIVLPCIAVCCTNRSIVAV